MAHSPSLRGLQSAAQERHESKESTDRSVKSAVLYLHKPGTDYQCKDCTMFIADTERCSIHGLDDVIRSYGSCGLFVKGDSMSDMHPMGNVTKLESGYDENRPGFSCKRCEYYLADRRDCQKVDPNTDGDDPGEIHPDACCNHWEHPD